MILEFNMKMGDKKNGSYTEKYCLINVLSLAKLGLVFFMAPIEYSTGCSQIQYYLNSRVKPQSKVMIHFSFFKDFFFLVHALTDYRRIKSDIYDFLIQIYAKRWAIFTRIFMQSRLM